MRHEDYIDKFGQYANNQASSFASSSTPKALPTDIVLENLFYVSMN